MMTDYFIAVVYSFAVGYVIGRWFNPEELEVEEVKKKVSLTLTKEDILRMLAKDQPELKVPPQAEILIDEAEYDDENMPLMVEWEE